MNNAFNGTIQHLATISPLCEDGTARSVRNVLQLYERQNLMKPDTSIISSFRNHLRTGQTQFVSQPLLPSLHPSTTRAVLDATEARRLLILRSIQNEETQRRVQATLQLERLKTRAILVRALHETSLTSEASPPSITLPKGSQHQSHEIEALLKSHRQSPPPASLILTHREASASSPLEDKVSTKKDGEAMLEYLGKRRREGNLAYVDASTIPITTAGKNKPKDPFPVVKKKKASGGVTETFPELLYRMLHEVQAQGQADIVAFLPHGRAFWVIDVPRFETQIMPQYFQHSKWASFSRQLNLYGFGRITDGPDDGAYYHELFLNGRPDLCRYLRRNGVPQRGKDRRKDRRRKEAGDDPDFYSMAPISMSKGSF